MEDDVGSLGTGGAMVPMDNALNGVALKAQYNHASAFILHRNQRYGPWLRYRMEYEKPCGYKATWHG